MTVSCCLQYIQALSHRLLFIIVFLSFPLFAKPSSSKEDFDQLMGKKTKHWKNVEQPVDQEALQKFKKLFDRHKSLKDESSTSLKIPKIVHFIWLGPRPFPPQSVLNIRTWIAQNPDWVFKFWTDREREPPCHGMEMILIQKYPFKLERCYESSENWGEKSDILRYEILYYQGGVYADHDTNCLQPFEPLHSAYDFYCSLETPHPPFVGLNITAANSLIGARAGHPVLQRTIELVEQKWDELAQKYPDKDGFSTTQVVMERTYMPFTYALDKVDEEGNVDIVMPAAYFSAKKGIKPLYSHHSFANSWAAPDLDKASFEKATQALLAKIDKKTQRVLIFIVILGAFNFVLLGWSLKFLKKSRTS